MTDGQMEWLGRFVLDLLMVTLLFVVDLASGHVHAPYRVSPWIVLPLLAAVITTFDRATKPQRQKLKSRIKRRLANRRLERARRATLD